MGSAEPRAGGRGGATKLGERDALRAELERVLAEQESLAQELSALVGERDTEALHAEQSDAALRSEELAVEDLQRRAHVAELRARAATEEEATCRELVRTLTAQQAEDATKQERQQAIWQQELAQLRSELAERQREALQHSREAERRRRLAADEQCLRLQAMLDYTQGQLDISLEDLESLVSDSAASPGGKGASASAAGAGRRRGHSPTAPGTDEQARWLLTRQREGHRDELRGLVALCNEELRRRDRSAAELVDDDGLPRLLVTLGREGVLDPGSCCTELPPDPQRAARLRQAVLGG